MTELLIIAGIVVWLLGFWTCRSMDRKIDNLNLFCEFLFWFPALLFEFFEGNEFSFDLPRIPRKKSFEIPPPGIPLQIWTEREAERLARSMFTDEERQWLKDNNNGAITNYFMDLYDVETMDKLLDVRYGLVKTNEYKTDKFDQEIIFNKELIDECYRRITSLRT